ncbi:MAG TPA: thioredoxin family protein [Stellaceae bacterium]|nr:thioredoxin family protein [Stellaceae bacterium]
MRHRIVSQGEWLAARRQLLLKEKEFTRLRDQLAAERRDLPWVRIDKTYLFDAPDGKQTLADLFDGRSQLIVKHFMLAPGQTSPCVGCSFEVDHLDGILVHLEHNDVAYVAVARAPLPEIEAVKRRMGWRFRWVSSFGSDFNYDFHVSFTPDQIAKGAAYYNYRSGSVPMEDLSGRSIFYKDADGEIFHTYSSFGRGGEDLLGTYRYFDLTPKGRNETGPYHNMHDWLRHHDRYGDASARDETGVASGRRAATTPPRR